MVRLSNEENKFLEFLAYQTSLNNKGEDFFNKIPFYEAQIEEKNNKIKEMIGEFEDIRRRDVYSLIVQEFSDLLEKNR